MLQRRKKEFQYHANKYNVHMYDFRLILYVWVLSIIGILVINSAADGFAVKQLMGFIGGSVVMIFFSLIDYNYIAKFEWFLYSINIGMLIAVKLLGIRENQQSDNDYQDRYSLCDPDALSRIGARSVDNACFCIFILYNDVCGRSQLQDHRYHIGDIGTVGRPADLVYSAAGTDFTPWLSASENFDVP